MIPKFNYTLPLRFYIKQLFGTKKKLPNNPLYTDLLFTNQARVGLRLLLSSISTKKLRVGVQVYTCNTIFQAIEKAGHEIVFLDITNDFKLDLNHLKAKRDKIDVLIITHTFGYPDSFDEIKEIIGNKIIIEDCAHAFQSIYKQKYCGTLSDASVFSFGLGKFPPIGSGGGILINNPDRFPLFKELYSELHYESYYRSFFAKFKIIIYSILLHKPFYSIITYKLGKKLDATFDFVDKFTFYQSKGYLFSKRMLLNYDPYVKKAIEINKINYEKIVGHVGLNHLNINTNTSPNYYIFPILTDGRDLLYEALLCNNIEAGKHFATSIEWALNFGYKSDCNNAEQISKRILTIPIHMSVTTMDIEKIEEFLNEYINVSKK